MTCFVAFNKSLGNSLAESLDALLFEHAVLDDGLDHVRTIERPAADASFCRNIATTPRLFMAGGRLVAVPELASALAASSTCELFSARVSKAFELPREDFRAPASLGEVDSLSEWVRQQAARFAVPPPSEGLYEIVPHDSRRLDRTQPQQRVLERRGSRGSDVRTSGRMIERHGLLWDGAWLCAPRIFDEIRADLETHAFVYARYAAD